MSYFTTLYAALRVSESRVWIGFLDGGFSDVLVPIFATGNECGESEDLLFYTALISSK